MFPKLPQLTILSTLESQRSSRKEDHAPHSFHLHPHITERVGMHLLPPLPTSYTVLLWKLLREGCSMGASPQWPTTADELIRAVDEYTLLYHLDQPIRSCGFCAEDCRSSSPAQRSFPKHTTNDLGRGQANNPQVPACQCNWKFSTGASGLSSSALW